jgi:hypothetical protein
MKYQIVEIDNRDKEKSQSSNSTPLTYRIELKIESYSEPNEITLKREYFYWGYNDGESIDGFYFDNEIGWSIEKYQITRATFLTRNFEPNYLKQKEKELIELFYSKLIKTEKDIEKKFIEDTKKYKNNLKKYQNYQTCDIFLRYKRKNKLDKINKLST